MSDEIPKIDQVLRGLQILRSYADSSISAQHDQIYAGPDAGDVTPEDRTRLEGLDWFVDEESWSCFV